METRSQESHSAKKKKRVILRFSAGCDVEMLKLILEHNPYDSSVGTTWHGLAPLVSAACSKQFTARAVKERSEFLLQKYKSRNLQELKRSGTEEELIERIKLVAEVYKLRSKFKGPPKTGRSTKKVEERSEIILLPSPRSISPVYGVELRTSENPLEERSRTPQSNAHVDNTAPQTPVARSSPTIVPLIHQQTAAVTPETPRNAFRKIAPKPSTTNPVDATIRDPQVDFMCVAIERLDEISNKISVSHSALSIKDDSYDFFGKYVASMLRGIGPPTAMRLQEKITSLITNTMCPSPPDHLQSDSGIHSSMSDNSDISTIVLIKSEK